MKNCRWQKLMSLLVSFAIMFNITMVPAFAEGEEAGEGKYVSDVYIAYGKTEDEAKKWLKKNGWEPLNGNADFNAGKASFFDDNKLQDQNVAAVMGIKRTDKASEAVTDLAVMNMKGGYSFPDYQALLKEKKTEIDEFIDTFIPVLEEYRKNYNGEGSAVGKKRAELAHDLLNRFYDGGEDEPYAANDTGKPLGDLFLEKVKQEGNDKGGDLQQIILESSGASVTTIEVCLALAADAEETPWIERIQGLSGDELSENLGKYVPEAEGQDIAPSAVKKFLKQHFGDQAKTLAGQWDVVHDDMVWYEEYCEKNDLIQHDGESDEDYAKRLKEKNEKKGEDADLTDDEKKYIRIFMLYGGLYRIPYEGEWGETLGDFFNPAEGPGYAGDVSSFLPIAAALSEGQRSAVELVSLETLLLLGMGTEESVSDLFTDIDSVFEDAEAISIYSGINRGIYRGGVALTNAALMEKNQNGYDPFADMWSFSGIYNITVYAAAITGVVLLGTGIGLLKQKPAEVPQVLTPAVKVDQAALDEAERNYQTNWSAYHREFRKAKEVKEKFGGDWSRTSYDKATVEANMEKYQEGMNKYQKEISDLEKQGEAKPVAQEVQKVSTSARVIMGIGGALLVAAAAAKGYQLYRYYQKTFTQIPVYIVDEADIVSYDKDEEGNDVKLIQFDQFVYYEAVKCNRQEVGEIGDWQDGVSDYAAWGCGDAADLNADMGQQWLALYQVKSDRKGYPVLADTLTLQYGSKAMPEGCSKALHMFTYESAQDIGDTAYAFNNGKKGIYFFWGVDEEAYAEEAASAFAGGTAAVSGGIGLLVGILGTAIVMRKKRREA